MQHQKVSILELKNSEIVLDKATVSGIKCQYSRAFLTKIVNFANPFPQNGRIEVDHEPTHDLGNI
jgi:hypothetical protein